MKESWEGLIYLKKDYSDSYEVSDKGNIRSIDRLVEYSDGRIRKHKGIALKKIKDRDGYLVVCLSLMGKRKTCPVHSAVTETFLRQLEPGECVDHLHDKENNELINLRIVTTRENCSREKSELRGLPTGVTLLKRRNSFMVRIYFSHLGNLYLGTYKELDTASKVYGSILSLSSITDPIQLKDIDSWVNNFRLNNNLEPLQRTLTPKN